MGLDESIILALLAALFRETERLNGSGVQHLCEALVHLWQVDASAMREVANMLANLATAEHKRKHHPDEEIPF